MASELGGLTRPSSDVRAWSSAAALALLTAAVALHANRHFNGDVYWLLAAGRDVWTHGFTEVDPFPTLNEGRAWQNQQWLTELILYGLHSLGGFTAISLGYAGVLGLATLPLVVGARRGHPVAYLLAAAAYVAALVAVVDPRAAGLSLACFSLLVLLVGGRRRAWRVWLVLPVVVVWANVHASFTVGYLLLGLVALGGAIDRRLGRGGEEFQVRFLVVLAALPLAFATPIGTELIPYFESLAGREILPELTFEWDPTWEHPYLLLFIAAFVAFTVRIWLSSPERPLEPVLVALGFAALAVTATRHLVWLGPVAFYVVRRCAAEPRLALSRWVTIPSAAGAVVLVCGWLVLSGPPPPQPGLAEPIVRAVAADPLSTRIAAKTGVGSLMLWYAPGQKVTVDGRFEVYSDEELRANQALLDGDLAADERLRGDVGALITRNPRAVAELRARGWSVLGRAGDSTLLERRP